MALLSRPPLAVARVTASPSARAALHGFIRRPSLAAAAASKGIGSSNSKPPTPPPPPNKKSDGGGGGARVRAAASKGFGSSNSKPPTPPTPPPAPKKSDDGDGGGARVRTADPELQRAATLLLTALVAETDPQKRAKIASENTDKIDGVFFGVADAYIKIARAEGGRGGGEEVVMGLEQAVRCALDAKQATLRPEIRLLNRLLDAQSLEERRAVLESERGAGAKLLRERASRDYMNQLLDRFSADVNAQGKAQAAATAKAGKKEEEDSPVAGLKRAIEETRSIVLAAAAAAGSGGKS